jgi:hypothetical protein
VSDPKGLLEEALHLPAEERAAGALIESLDLDVDEDVEAAWQSKKLKPPLVRRTKFAQPVHWAGHLRPSWSSILNHVCTSDLEGLPKDQPREHPHQGVPGNRVERDDLVSSAVHCVDYNPGTKGPIGCPMRHDLRTAGLTATIGYLACAATWAQAPAAATIRCAQCASSGQKRDASAADFSQITIVEQLKPAFYEGRTIQDEIIGRVLAVSPFLVETLDSRAQLVVRNVKPIAGLPDDDFGCSVLRIERVDRASQPILAGLRLNDLITGRLVWQEDGQRPEVLLEAKQVLTRIRHVTTPVRYLHTPPLAACANRSGRLMEYRGPSYDSLTVYNDGAIDYRDTGQRHFNREKLSDQELSELLRAFAAASFDAIRADIGDPGMGPMPGITLIAARYQDVWLAGKEERLAPLVSRLKEVIARSMSQTSLLLMPGTRQTLTIVPWPYARVARLEGYMAARDTARSRRQSGETQPGGPFEERLPDEFLNRLPGTPQMQLRDRDPNRLAYFSEDNALYRVAHNPQCTGADWYCKSFYRLDVERIETIDTRLRAQAARTFLSNPPGSPNTTLRSVDPARMADYNIYLGGGANVYLWTPDMVSTLAALSPTGVTLPPDEYERHGAVYRAILNRGERGIALIENGVLFEHVRLCQIEKGVVDACAVR